MKLGYYIVLIAVVWSFVLLLPDKSYGIPSFARKYQTSCATCHNGFPKLTPFGEAFRRNGYQFPAGTDAEYIKEKPITLSSDGNKRAFPDAIWPGTLPATSPISLFFNGEMDYNPHAQPRFTFDGLGSSIEAVAAGTIGEDVSFWGHAILNSDGTLELNRMFLIFSNIVGNSLALNARVGVIEPGLFSFSTHRSWLEDYWFTTRAFNNDMGWTFEETQKGIEVNGVIGGRFGYNAGLVEAFGPPHSGKDFYGHVTYKVGGMPLDGVVEGGPSLGATKPYIDDSFTAGAFFYRGSAVIGTADSPQGNNFTEFGGDVNLYLDRFNLFGGVGVRHDDDPFVGFQSQSANTTTWFSELDYVLYPWFLPGIRFESWNSSTIDPGSGQTSSYTDSQIVPGIVFLIRTNLKAAIRTSIAKMESTGDSKFQFGQVSLALALGI